MRTLLACTSVILALSVTVGGATAAMQTAAANSPEDATSKRIAEAINHEGRSAADRERDRRSKPAEILTLLELSPGQTVMDVFAGGGYYSELMAYIVGPQGKVLLHNNKAYKNYTGKELEKRFQGRELSQIEIYDKEANDLGLAPASLNAAIMVMSFHDLYFADEKDGWPPIDSKDFLGQLHTALKPGGKLLIVDHAAKEGSGSSAAQDLHRIEEAFAKQEIEQIGFSLIGSSDSLRNSADARNMLVFDDEIRGKTDRFVLLFARQGKAPE